MDTSLRREGLGDLNFGSRHTAESINKASVIRSKAKVFLFNTDRLRGEEIASVIVVARLRIIDYCERKAGPFFVRVSKHAEVSPPQCFSPDEQAAAFAGIDDQTMEEIVAQTAVVPRPE